MGIENIDFLKPDLFPETKVQVTRKGPVSQHIVHDEKFKFVFGWDQPLRSFYLQKHDLTREADEQIIVWLGATTDTTMYEVEDLVRASRRHGLRIDHSIRVQLYGEKDDGQ